MKKPIVKRFKDFYYSPKKVIGRFLKNSPVLDWAIPKASSPEELQKLIAKQLARIKAGDVDGPVRILFVDKYKIKELQIHKTVNGDFETKIEENPCLRIN